MPELMCECSRCTANIEFREQDQVVRCKYCQYPNQRPQATGGMLDKLKRGNRLLQQCQFEEAEDCYEDVLKQYPDEAEALWGRLMCKYGVEVAKEEKYGTVRRYLLCHRARRSSIRNEGDFHDACKHADPLVREQYERDAEYIDNVQHKIREAAQRQESYDVFICYKETDLETGERTRDSMIAQQLYNQYIYDGYRVFFARETLCDKMGEDYEAAIYQAIATAKVMLVVGLKKEHFQAVWPKSEWMRYLEKMEQGEGLLIPVYGEMKAEELPEQFINLGLPGCCIETDLAYIEDIESKLYRIIHKPVPQRRENSAAVSDKPQEMMYPDGKYVGEIVNGNRHGKGVMYYSNADEDNRLKYDGEWKNNRCHGKGVMYYSNGNKYDGEWKDNRYHGHGMKIWKSGAKYDGEWKRHMYTGNGVYTWPDGSKYDGEWTEGRRNGYGVMYYSNGNKYDGEWIDGKPTGKGVFFFANGDRYEGEFYNGEFVGRGTFIKQCGKRICCQDGKPKKFF